MIRWCILLLLTFACSAGVGLEKDPESKFRVLGYLFSQNDWKSGLEAIDWSMYTDINLAFIQPDSKGRFSANEAYREVVKPTHDSGVRVFISIGGGDPPEFLPDSREENSLLNAVKKSNGIKGETSKVTGGCRKLYNTWTGNRI